MKAVNYGSFGVQNVGNTQVQITVTGANPFTTIVVTDSTGAAILSYLGVNAGTDMVTGSSNGSVSNTVPVTWIATPPELTSSPVTGRFFTADGTGVFNTPASQPPVFTQVFLNIDFNPAPGAVPNNTSNVSNLTRPFTAVVTDSHGNFAGTLPAQNSNFQAGAATLYNFSAVFTGSLSVPWPGQVTITFSSDSAFIFGIGNGAARISGPQTATPAGTPFQGYPVMGGVNQLSTVASNSITVNFPAAGTYSYEVDYAKGGDKNLTLTMLSGGMPIPAAALLTLTPAVLPSAQAGQVQSLQAIATGLDGLALPALNVLVGVTGVNPQDQTLTTDGTGQFTFAYAGNPLLNGTDQIQASADAATTSYTYDLAGRKLAQTDPRGNTTTYAYDAAGRIISMRDAVGNTTTYGYDGKGQRTSMTDAKNRITTYTYDSRGHKLTTTTPDGKTVSKTYDGLGLTLTSTDEESRTTAFGYDAGSQLLSVTDALNQVTQYGYDLAGNKIIQTDARNNSTTHAYDNLNRRTRRTLPLGQSESFTYDPVGNMTSRTEFNGKTTTLGYDSLDRSLSRTPDGSFSAPPTTFTYTASGQRLTMSDASGSTSYTYNNRDQVLTKATPQGTLTYTYDAAGNVTSVVSSNANGTSVAYAWDANNRLSSVTDNPTNGTTNYSYDATNQISSFVSPNGVTHTYSYDTRDRVLALNGYTQTFSASGRKQSAAESSGRTANYGYDSIYRLLDESISGDPVSANNGGLAYMLDPVGNRQALTSTLAALQSQTASFDADDRISGDTFDSNGNTLTSNGVMYAYDFEDRLLSTSSGVQITYDGDGNRVSETVGGVTTRFLVDDLTPTGYAQVAEELVNGTVSAQYTHGAMRISQRRTSVSYYGYDPGANVRQLFDSTAAITDSYAYDAFGNTVAHSGTTVNPYLYRGEQYDANLVTYYLRARYFRPRTGRFLTADTYEGDDEEPLNLHRFLYSDADPANKKDPSGLDSTITWGETLGPEERVLVTAGFVVTAGLYVCTATPLKTSPPCDLENRGKIQAQGWDFKDPGEGISWTWDLPVPLPATLGELGLAAIVARLNDTQRKNRMVAAAKAAIWIAAVRAAGGTGPPGKSFVKGAWRNALNAPRIDIDIFNGWAFVFP